MTSREKKSVDKHIGPTPLAIVGIGCMFPKANSLGAYWANICDGVDAISEVPDSHWKPADYYDADHAAADMTYGRRGGFLEPVDFDPLLYGMTPNSIEATDTTQLLGLMVTHRALRDAGYSTGKDAGDGKEFNRDRTSVILGVTGTLELVIPLGARLGHPVWRKALKDAGIDPATAEDVVERIAAGYVPWQENSFPGLLGNVAAGRIANRFDLGGTNCVVDAACASSLSAIHMAAMELYAGRADMAITGGLDTFNDIFMYMCFSKTPALSASGDSRPFSADADGTILGEGLGVTVIKRLADAERDGDKIYAVIKSIGTSSDGKGNAVYAPSSTGQKKALLDAYDLAGIEPTSIELLEAHGTGTKVGDVVEAKALAEVYGGAGGEGSQPWCALGSVKSMIGHTKAAAGVAGMIKAVMALNSKVLPPTIKVSYPLEPVEPGVSPFYVNTEKRPWMGKVEHKRRAALSAFGFGGSNFHAVLEEYDTEKTAAEYDGSVLLIPVSGKSADVIDRTLQALSNVEDWDLLRAKAGELREGFDAGAKCRLVLVAEREKTDVARLIENARKQLKANGETNWTTPDGAFYGCGEKDGELAVMFPGQGSQRTGMLRDLACQYPEVLESLGIGNEVWGDDESRLSDFIYPQPRFDDAARQVDEDALKDTRVAQPSLGATSAGAWKVLQGFGIEAGMFGGHSFGELTALWAGGRYDEAGLIELAKVRGELMGAGEGDRGGMLAVSAGMDMVEGVIADEKLDVVVANHNGPTQVVVSGSSLAVEKAAGVFKDKGVRVTRLAVAAAFHSELVAEAAGPFGEAMKGVKFTAATKLPKVKVYANTTGDEYPTAVSKAKQLLANQLARPVKFVEQVEKMYADGASVFVEVGPGGVLTGLVKRILDGKDIVAVAMEGSKGTKNGQYELAMALGQLAVLGHGVDFAKWDDGWRDEVGQLLEKKKPGLVMKLTGANYVNERPSKPASKPRQVVADTATGGGESVVANQNTIQPQKGTQALNPTPQNTPGNTGSLPPAQPLDGSQVSQALAATQQSIAALQAMQQQTAQLHQQYLQGQEAAQQTIQQLVMQQQMLMSGNVASATVMPQPVQPVGQPIQPIQAAVPPVVQPIQPVQQPAAPAIPVQQAAPIQQPPAPLPTTDHPTPPEPAGDSSVKQEVKGSGAASGKTKEVLLEVVSQKTGYPVEMLEMEMSLDADLGIDSIKRVEILSALQEKLPDLPQVQPDDMGALGTLGEIVDYLGEGDAGGEDVYTQALSGKTGGVDGDTFKQALLEVVAEKTGYPVEMLELEMSLDADLGIDSIKRVEILSALQEKLPDAPQVQPDDLGALGTLGEIVAYMSSNAPSGDARVSDTTAATVSMGGGVDADTFKQALLEVVAEKTGYPVEMLELEMSLDADLGIDSIKRVEILSALQEKLPDAPQVQPDDLGALGTLGEIVEYMSEGGEQPGESQTADKGSEVESVKASDLEITDDIPSPQPSPGGRGGTSQVETDVLLDRQVLAAKELSDADKREVFDFPKGSEVWVTDDGSVLTKLVCKGFKTRGYQPVAVQSLEDITERSGEMPCGLVLLGPAEAEVEYIGAAFNLMQGLGERLRGAGEDAFLMSVSRLDGQFGLTGKVVNAVTGGLAGLVKTAGHEWELGNCKAVDAADDFENLIDLAGVIVDEALTVGPPEVGISSEGLYELALEHEAVGDVGEKRIDAGDVVVISGGARGVTASVAEAMAKSWGGNYLLLGRSAMPDDEPLWMVNLEGEDAIRKALIEQGDAGTPKEINTQVATIMAGREMLANMAKIEAEGGKVIYRSVDIRDAEAVSEAIAAVRESVGPIAGIVHGAGVLADRLIADKTAEQFEMVYSTKVDGLNALLQATADDDLKVMVMFSSSTGRFGRRGQVDYAAANEVLNKVAQQQNRLREECRVVSVNWGPWDGGMVNDSLKKVFAEEGIGVIPLQAGGDYLVKELGGDVGGPVEVVLIGALEGSDLAGGGAGQAAVSADLHLAFEREVNVASMPVLASHVMNGKAVLPMALMVEWLAHGAMHDNPGMLFHGFDDLQVFKGVILDGDASVSLQVYSGRGTIHEGLDFVTTELRSGDVLHARATIVLAADLPEGPGAELEVDGAEYSVGDDAIYESGRLFHGEALAGIESILCCGEQGIVGQVKAGVQPNAWIAQPMRSTWIADPMALDSSFQMMILWSFEQNGVGSLPTGIKHYRQYQRAYAKGSVQVTAKITSNREHAAEAGIEFVDGGGGKIIAVIDGYECVIDGSLSEAFAKNQLTEAANA